MSTQTQEKENRVEIFPVVFKATGRNLRLIRVPVRKVIVNLTQDFTEGLDYVFEPDGPGGTGKLEVTEELLERDRRFFERNDPNFDGNPRTLEWLRAHNLYGDRFLEVPPTPPDPKGVLEQITAAAARGDETTLTELYEQEDRTFKRPEILEPITGALDAIEERRAIEQQPPEAPSAMAGAETFRPPEQPE